MSVKPLLNSEERRIQSSMRGCDVINGDIIMPESDIACLLGAVGRVRGLLWELIDWTRMTQRLYLKLENPELYEQITEELGAISRQSPQSEGATRQGL